MSALAGLAALVSAGCAAPSVDVTGYRARAGFDVSRVDARGPNQFEPLAAPEQGLPASAVGWDPSDTVLVLSAGGGHRAFLARDMVYHHVAQGTLAGVPYLVVY